MKSHSPALALIMFFAVTWPAPEAIAQVVTLPQVKNGGGVSVPSQGVVLVDPTGRPIGKDNALSTSASVSDSSMSTIASVSAVGSIVPGRPPCARTVAIYLTSSDSITYTIATSQPATAPVATITVSGGAFAVWSETLGPATNLYVTAVTGAPRYRWQ